MGITQALPVSDEKRFEGNKPRKISSLSLKKQVYNEGQSGVLPSGYRICISGIQRQRIKKQNNYSKDKWRQASTGFWKNKSIQDHQINMYGSCLNKSNNCSASSINRKQWRFSLPFQQQYLQTILQKSNQKAIQSNQFRQFREFRSKLTEMVQYQINNSEHFVSIENLYIQVQNIRNVQRQAIIRNYIKQQFFSLKDSIIFKNYDICGNNVIIKIIAEIRIPNYSLNDYFEYKKSAGMSFSQFELFFIANFLSNVINDLSLRESRINESCDYRKWNKNMSIEMSDILIDEVGGLRMIDPICLSSVHSLAMNSQLIKRQQEKPFEDNRKKYGQCSIEQLNIKKIGYLLMELALMHKPAKYNFLHGNNRVVSQGYSFDLVILIDKMINHYITAKGVIKDTNQKIKNLKIKLRQQQQKQFGTAHLQRYQMTENQTQLLKSGKISKHYNKQSLHLKTEIQNLFMSKNDALSQQLQFTSDYMRLQSQGNQRIQSNRMKKTMMNGKKEQENEINYCFNYVKNKTSSTLFNQTDRSSKQIYKSSNEDPHKQTSLQPDFKRKKPNLSIKVQMQAIMLSKTSQSQNDMRKSNQQAQLDPIKCNQNTDLELIKSLFPQRYKNQYLSNANKAVRCLDKSNQIEQLNKNKRKVSMKEIKKSNSLNLLKMQKYPYKINNQAMQLSKKLMRKKAQTIKQIQKQFMLFYPDIHKSEGCQGQQGNKNQKNCRKPSIVDQIENSYNLTASEHRENQYIKSIQDSQYLKIQSCKGSSEGQKYWNQQRRQQQQLKDSGSLIDILSGSIKIQEEGMTYSCQNMLSTPVLRPEAQIRKVEELKGDSQISQNSYDYVSRRIDKSQQSLQLSPVQHVQEQYIENQYYSEVSTTNYSKQQQQMDQRRATFMVPHSSPRNSTIEEVDEEDSISYQCQTSLDQALQNEAKGINLGILLQNYSIRNNQFHHKQIRKFDDNSNQQRKNDSQSSLSNSESISIVQYAAQQLNNSYYQGYVDFSGLKQGIGKLVDSHGNVYQGQWHQDKRHGFGKLYKNIINSSGKSETTLIYQGFWQQNYYHGKGKIYNQIKQKVDSSYNRSKPLKFFENDFRNISQQDIRQKWKSYDGEFVLGIKNGTGILKFYNGQVFQGEWRNDYVNGCGIYYTLSSEFIKGVWQNGKLVQLTSECA